MIYNRNTYEGKFLRKEDFITGLGFNTSILGKLREIKEIKKSSEFDFYHENGMSIDGTIRVKKYHPLLNKVLIDNREDENGRELIVESVHKHWYNGYYWMLVYRIGGTKSHGSFSFKNINSIDSTILEGIEEDTKNITFKEDGLNWDKF